MVLSENIQSCVLPGVFETGIDEAPHRVFGSCFLIGYQKRAFAVTARHVLQLEWGLSPMCVRSPSGRLLPLIDVFFFSQSESQEDFADIAIVEIDLQLLVGDMGETRLLPLRHDDEDWFPLRYISRFVILGFPNEHAYVDYQAGEIVEGLVELVGEYTMSAESAHLHEITIENPPPLEDYSGFSGSPVFMLKRSIGAQPVPIFCGVAIQGTATSRKVRFIERSILLCMLDAKLKVSCAG